MPVELTAVLKDPSRLAVLRDAVSPRAYPANAYDPLTRVAAGALDVPVALVSLVDDKGQFFHGASGLLGEIAVCRSTPLSHSFCKHVVASGAVLRVVDSRVHPLVHDNPIIEQLGVIGYLGMPLTTSDGHVLGSLCAITHEPREWTPADEDTLRDLSKIVISDLELRADLAHRERLDAGRDPSLDAEGLPHSIGELLEQLHEGAAAIDRQWKVTYVNRVGARALQVAQEGVIGQSLWHAVPALVNTAFAELLHEVALTRRTAEAEVFVPATQRWYDVRAVSARHGLSVYFADTTDRREALEALKVREEQLRHSQKMEAVGALAGGIAHDFNNLLTIIRGNTELLLDQVMPHDTLYADLREVYDAAARAAALTQQLLAFGRKQVIRPRPVNVGATVDALVPMLRRLIPATVSIESRTPDDLPAVLIDAGQLEQVVVNLVVNARDAMPAGGQLRVHVSAVQLAAPLRDGHVEVPAGHWVTVTVQDTGNGIAPEDLARIFEPFFTTKAIGKGTGLGLATAFRIVDDARGMFSVESRPSRGTRMRVYLPALDTPPDAGEPETSGSTRLISSTFG